MLAGVLWGYESLLNTQALVHLSNHSTVYAGAYKIKFSPPILSKLDTSKNHDNTKMKNKNKALLNS